MKIFLRNIKITTVSNGSSVNIGKTLNIVRNSKEEEDSNNASATNPWIPQPFNQGNPPMTIPPSGPAPISTPIPPRNIRL